MFVPKKTKIASSALSNPPSLQVLKLSLYNLFIRQDLQCLCYELQLDESVEDLMQQLGANEQGYVSYAQFILCHNKLQWSSHLTSDTMEQNSSDKSQVFRRRDAKNASGMKLLRR